MREIRIGVRHALAECVEDGLADKSDMVRFNRESAWVMP